MPGNGLETVISGGEMAGNGLRFHFPFPAVSSRFHGKWKRALGNGLETGRKRPSRCYSHSSLFCWFGRRVPLEGRTPHLKQKLCYSSMRQDFVNFPFENEADSVFHCEHLRYHLPYHLAGHLPDFWPNI